MKGVYLFDLWTNGLITQNAANAGAVQVALWQSEGYSTLAIENTGGFSSSLFNSATADITSLLQVTERQRFLFFDLDPDPKRFPPSS